MKNIIKSEKHNDGLFCADARVSTGCFYITAMGQFSRLELSSSAFVQTRSQFYRRQDRFVRVENFGESQHHKHFVTRILEGNKIVVVSLGQIRSGMGTYAGAARRRVHLATVLLRPPSGHPPGRRQARHAHILQIRLDLTQL